MISYSSLPLLLAAFSALGFLALADPGAGEGEKTAGVKKAAVESKDPKGPAPKPAGDKLLFRFGAVADCQYCDADSKRRRYRMSVKKLRACVEDFNKQDLTHLVHLGDFIDRDWKSFDDVLPIMQTSKAPVRFVLGNHDFSVADEFKDKVPGRLGLTSRYYDFAVGKWRFLVLDTNDVSLYAYPKGSEKYKASQAIYQKLGGKLPKYNGAIGKEQMAWIEKKLKEAQAAGESVILHSHHPVYPYGRSHAAWNAVEVVALLEKYPCVAAYINGHNHDGAYGLKQGIHYLTMKGMVDTEETSYAVVDVYEKRLEIKGRGRQDNYVLKISQRSTKTTTRQP